MEKTATINEAMEIEPIQRLERDLKRAAASLSTREARYLVDYYYIEQENRKRADNQIRALSEGAEPHEVVGWLSDNTRRLENNIKAALEVYSLANPVGQWAQSIVGIGPVISAGLLAHIDIEKAPTYGHIWSFAGLNPTVTWGKGEKRPWNAKLKTLCWKAGESFVKFSNHPHSTYGRLWRERKEAEVARNEAGEFEWQAQHVLETIKIGKDTDAYAYYTSGKLPPAHVHGRAKRWVVKLFLSHWHYVAFEVRWGVAPPLPYPFAQQEGHAHLIAPPNWEPLAAD